MTERILDAFSEKAKRSGLRSVTMGQLVTELRMSASTLYREFPSKEELTMACVERWASELAVAESEQTRAGRDGYERFLRWAETWAETNAALQFDRDKARGRRLDIPAGTAVRFEPGQTREVSLVPFAGKREVYGFQGRVMGKL